MARKKFRSNGLTTVKSRVGSRPLGFFGRKVDILIGDRIDALLSEELTPPPPELPPPVVPPPVPPPIIPPPVGGMLSSSNEKASSALLASG